MAKYFFFGQVLRGSQDNVTKGPDFVVSGGAGKEHKDTVEIIKLFKEGVEMDGPHHAQEILKDAVKKIRG